MKIEPEELRDHLDTLARAGLLSASELEDILELFDPAFHLADAIECAESVHLHIRVDDLAPFRAALASIGPAENEKDGYVKHRSELGVHVIVSSIDIAEDDRVTSLPRRARPHLDHIGIDLRDHSAASRAIFDRIPARATERSWRRAHQGGGGQAVLCCHTSVAEKHWLYPPSCAKIQTTVEIAFGPLQVGDGMGVLDDA
jgi:hypothetical protein